MRPFNPRQIIDRSPHELTPRPNNPRTHTGKQIRQIADSINEFGFTNPVLIDCENKVIAGHGRLKAAKLLGLETVPTLCLDHLNAAQIRAYVIADNRLAELAGWDREILAIEFQGLIELETDFDVRLTGFEMPEIDIILGALDDDDGPDPADDVPEVLDTPPVTRLGDLWKIGSHRLLCGDAREEESYARLLDGEAAEMIFTDPPYNVPIDGHVCGLGKTRHREFACASGEMTKTQYTVFLTDVFKSLAACSAVGAIHFICMDWRHIGEVMTAGDIAYSELKNLCVWAKTNGGMGSLYRSQHEFVFVFKSGTAPHINNVELGKFGRYRTNLWNYPGQNSFGAQRGDLELHPTVKPVALVADAIRDCSHRGHIVLDALAGSGTTLIAAEKTRRRGYGIELDPIYCDTIIKRLKRTCGLEAIFEASGQSFDEIAALRANTLAKTGPNGLTKEDAV